MSRITLKLCYNYSQISFKRELLIGTVPESDLNKHGSAPGCCYLEIGPYIKQNGIFQPILSNYAEMSALTNQGWIAIEICLQTKHLLPIIFWLDIHKKKSLSDARHQYWTWLLYYKILLVWSSSHLLLNILEDLSKHTDIPPIVFHITREVQNKLGLSSAMTSSPWADCPLPSG